MAPENHYRIPQSLEQVIQIPRSLHPHLKWWLQEAKSYKVSYYTHPACSSDFYICLNRMLGLSLRRSHGKRDLILARKQVTYKLPGTKGGLLGPKRVPRPLFKQDGVHSNRQHQSCCPHKQRRRHEIGCIVWPTVENPDLVLQETVDSQRPIHYRLAEFGSRQAIQSMPDHSDRIVPASRGLPVDMHQVAPTSNRPYRNKVQQQTTSDCVTSSRLPSLSIRYTQSAFEGSGPICLSTSSHPGHSGGKIKGLLVQENHSDCYKVAQYARVLGSGSHVRPDNPVLAQPADSAIQSDSTQESIEPKSPCLAPASEIKEQGFSDAVAA